MALHLLLILLVAGLQLIHAKCDYTVTGYVKVTHQLAELAAKHGSTSALENIQVKVSAKKKILGVWGTWGKWDTVRTSSSGKFTVNKRKSCSNRRFKVQVKFDDDELEVRHETSTININKVKWYTIKEQTSGFYDGSDTSISLNTFIFKSSGGKDLNDAEARAHADIWVLYHDAIGLVKSYGSGYKFSGKIKIKYPHDGIVSDSVEGNYANPFTGVIYVIKNSVSDGFNTGTLLHELGHIWAFQHSTGESKLATYLIAHGTTHGSVENAYVSFHEGFASYWNLKLKEILYGLTPALPFSREHLFIDNALTSRSKAQKNDIGALSALLMLTLPDITDFDLGDKSASGGFTTRVATDAPSRLMTCGPPTLSFKNILRVFCSKSSAGFDKDIDTDEMNFASFFQRAADILSGFSTSDANNFLDFVNPASSVQPKDAYCVSVTPNFSHIPRASMATEGIRAVPTDIAPIASTVKLTPESKLTPKSSLTPQSSLTPKSTSGSRLFSAARKDLERGFHTRP